MDAQSSELHLSRRFGFDVDGRRKARRELSFAEVYDCCAPAVLRYLLSRVGRHDVAEDLAAETFERAFRGWAGYEGRSSPTTWLLGIAHYVLLDYLRRHRAAVSWQALEMDLPDRTAAGPDEIAGVNETERALRSAVARLPVADQEVVALRFAADLSFREIGTVLGIREVTARVRLHRALRHLKTILGDREV